MSKSLTPKIFFKFIFLPTFALLLFACGDGGEGGRSGNIDISNSTNNSITTTNSNTVAIGVIGAVL